MSYYGSDEWRPYVPVAQRRAQAKRAMAALKKTGVDVQPVEVEGRKIARTFWGAGWCDHLESFSDYESRLPRGRTYVRNGSVCHLAIRPGEVEAIVSGSELYNVKIRINLLSKKAWAGLRKRCTGRIGSLLELLQGKLSDQVMAVVTERKAGLFPRPRGIDFDCDCPDWATMCKHVAAVLYGVGARLDSQPELLFLLRGVNQEELVVEDTESAVGASTRRGGAKRLADDDLGDVFGIEIDEPMPAARPRARRKRKASRPKKAATKKTGKKKAVRRKAAKKRGRKKKAAARQKATPKRAKKKATPKRAKKKPAARKRRAKKKTAGAKGPRRT